MLPYCESGDSLVTVPGRSGYVWQDRGPDKHRRDLVRHFSISVFSSQLCGQLGQVACLLPAAYLGFS